MIDVHRHSDWEERLAAYLEGVRARPFAWGRHDCCNFAAGVVQAMTGVDAMAEFRGHYTSASGARRALRKYGAGTLSATLDGKFARVRPSLAQRGDLVMTAGVLSICAGAFAFAVGSEGDRVGLVKIDRRDWTDPAAWRVPY